MSLLPKDAPLPKEPTSIASRNKRADELLGKVVFALHRKSAAPADDDAAVISALSLIEDKNRAADEMEARLSSDAIPPRIIKRTVLVMEKSYRCIALADGFLSFQAGQIVDVHLKEELKAAGAAFREIEFREIVQP